MGLKQHKVVFTQKSQDSIKHIFDYVKEQSSVAIAKKVRSAIIAKAKSLQVFAGYSSDRYLLELGRNYRSVTVWDYLIIYRLEHEMVVVLNVIHTKMHPIQRKQI